MPTETGIYTPEDAAIGHAFSYRLAQFIGQYLSKDQPVIDLGCGPGTYIRYLHDIGFKKLTGIEGTEQPFEYAHIINWDLTGEVKYLTPGNVLCLEVGEHIPAEHLAKFLDNAVSYIAPDGKLIISWAIPGQDGIGHVSCRHNIWVINELQQRGYAFIPDDSLSARSTIEENVNYFRNTLMIFKKA